LGADASFYSAASPEKFTHSGGSKMKKIKINPRVGSTEDFFARLLEHAKKLD
jgi:hypothetical protein